MAVTIWTDEQIATLAKLWVNHSAKQIAHHFQQAGFPVTRSAVIGRAHRSGLSVDQKDGFERSALGGIRSTSQALKAPRKRAPRVRKPAASRPVVHVVRCVEVNPRHLLQDDLRHGDCRYPYGDGPFTFCANPVFHGSYCEPHHNSTHMAPR